jgi:putative phosphoesterase
MKKMRVGVVSDSHGEIDNLKKVADLLIDKYNVDVIVHLGDDYNDTFVLDNLGVKLVKVPGVFSSYYQNRDISNRIVENFNDRRVLITHTECSHENDLNGDVKPEELIDSKFVDVVLCGHTHVPRIEQIQDVLYINPGHLRSQDKKTFPPTFAVIDFNDQTKVGIYNLMGEIVLYEFF